MHSSQQIPIEFANFKIYKKAGEIHGKGSDTAGPFEIMGRISNNICTFIKRNTVSQQTIFFSGVLLNSILEGKCEINGTYC